MKGEKIKESIFGISTSQGILMRRVCLCVCLRACVFVCLCVCLRARARVCACVRLFVGKEVCKKWSKGGLVRRCTLAGGDC